MSLCVLSLTEMAADIREGRITSAELVHDCLERVAEVDSKVQAWAFLDRAHAMRQAEVADLCRKQGKALGSLHGLPIGIKDIFDTGDMPTELGSPLWAGRTPRRDAAVVARLRAAGAVIMGKTVTTEYAYFQPGKTTNPHAAGRTPGGSSSGSAAAVAAGMVPLAVGSQTNGSVIRPAAFCGVYGFKPTHGLVSRHGVLTLSRTLDHVGVFGRCLEDIALLMECLPGVDEHDPDTRVQARIPFRELAAQDPPLPPLLAFAQTPAWEHAEEHTREAFAELTAHLAGNLVDLDLPGATAQAIEWHRVIMEAEMAANLGDEWERGREQLSASLRAQLARGRDVSALEYQHAVARIPAINAGFEEIFERCDAIVTPAAPGAAPLGLDSTGNPVFCTLWTYLGMPAITLPLMRAQNGLPIGVQLVGQRHADARLLRTARWLVERVQSTDDN